MFSTTAICGWNSSTVSSWKLDTSSTLTVSGVLGAIKSITGVPMFPPTSVGPPASAKILPSREVVVVLPFEPVIATTLPCRNRLASSSSPIIGGPAVPNARTCASSGVSYGTPGETTIRSCRRNVSSPCPPVSTMMPASSSVGMSFSSATALRVSDTVTRAPWSRRNSAAAIPLFPNPTTSTRLFFSSISLLRRKIPGKHDDRNRAEDDHPKSGQPIPLLGQ